LHNKIADTRKDFLHKLSTKVVNENQVITLEDLNVSGMVKNKSLATAISLQDWREFRLLCEAKSEKFGRTFNTVNCQQMGAYKSSLLVLWLQMGKIGS
jgi:putative transposase